MFTRDQTETGFRKLNPTRVEEMPISQSFALMVHFFQASKPKSAAQYDGDMLLFQWGTYDWGDDPNYAVNLCRKSFTR